MNHPKPSSLKFSALFLLGTAIPLSVACASDTADGAEAQSAQQLAATSPASTDSPILAQTAGRQRGGQRGPEAFFSRWDQDGDGKVKIADLPDPPRSRIAAADKNQDGQLTREELQAFHASRASQGYGRGMRGHNGGPFAKFDKDGSITLSELPDPARAHLAQADANHDGKVTRDELDAARPQMRAAMKAKMDKDGDGLVSDQERAAFRSERRAARFAAADKNKDGALSKDEVPEWRWNRISVADANQDGKVTQDELDAAFKSGQLKPRGPGRGQGGPR